MSYRHLTEAERTVIFYLRMDGRSRNQIAQKLGRHPSTIGRELRRNRNISGHYRPDVAQIKANARRRPRPATASSGGGSSTSATFSASTFST